MDSGLEITAITGVSAVKRCSIGAVPNVLAHAAHAVQVSYKSRHHALRNHYIMSIGRRWHIIAAETRIQVFDRSIGNAGGFGNIAERNAFIHQDVVGQLLVQIGFIRPKAMQRIVIAEISGSNKSRYIIAGFLRQETLNRPEVATACAANSAVDTGWAAVVGGQSQRPVVKLIVQCFQVTSRGIGAFDRVAAVFHGAVGAQAVVATCVGHKLPQSGSAHPGNGFWIEGRFHYRQIFQIRGNTIFFQFLFKQREVGQAAAQHGAGFIGFYLYVCFYVPFYNTIGTKFDTTAEFRQAFFELSICKGASTLCYHHIRGIDRVFQVRYLDFALC